jgi:hypothetical protein
MCADWCLVLAQVYGAVWNDKESLLASYGSDGKIRTWEFDEQKEFEFEGELDF